MSRVHVVRPGECLSSIADRSGFFWQTLWDHPDNAALKEARRDPNALAPGDEVHVPEKQLREEPRPIDAAHRFRKKGVPTWLRLRLLDEGEPRAGVPYVLGLPGEERRGATDGDGRLEEPIPPRVTSAVLVVGEGEDAITYELRVGHAGAIETDAGVAARLANLGLGGGPSEDARRAAIAAFQAIEELDATGELDDATRDALAARYEG